MDNFYTILLYIGAFLLIGLIKSINKAGKKKPAAVNNSFSDVEEKKKEAPYDFDAIFNFLQENPVSPKTEAKPRKQKKSLPAVTVQNEAVMAVEKGSDVPVTFAEKEETFVFEDFDLPTAIVYSEILKRPNY